MKVIRKRKLNEIIRAKDYFKCKKYSFQLPGGNSGWIGMKIKNAINTSAPGCSDIVLEIWETDESCDPVDIRIQPSSEDKGYCSY